MTYKEDYRDLFSVPEDYYLAHCISADFGMGKGIVVEFNKRFNMKRILEKEYPNYLFLWQSEGMIGDCILQGRVFNLITKERYWMKPTYKSFIIALQEMKYICDKFHIKKIAMPTIGAELDKLDFNIVKGTIKGVFRNTEVEILVCKQ